MIASPLKIAWHHEKVASFLAGRSFHPVCIELDLTTACPRDCELCPKGSSPRDAELDLPFLERLFAACARDTRGLLLSGGEPTLSPLLPRALALARREGFTEIAVVTSGSGLDDEVVCEALLTGASVVRVSLYGWEDPQSSGQLAATLGRVTRLRRSSELAGSPLTVGVSALTSGPRAHRLEQLTRQVRDAGADWIYFHPLCDGWGSSSLRRADQTGVATALAACAGLTTEGFAVHSCRQRYERHAVESGAYHAASFLLVVGADGLAYVGTEVKYNPAYALADLRATDIGRFLTAPDRLARCATDSRRYAGTGGFHRGVLYSDLLDALKTGRQDLDATATAARRAGLRFPHVL